MPQTNLVSFIIPQADKDAILQHLAGLKALLQPYVYPLTDDQRDTLPRMGDKTLPFVQKALEYAGINKEFLPQTVDMAEWQKDLDSWQVLTGIKNQLQQLMADVTDTTILLGSEAYTPARFYNDQVKMGVKQGVASAKPIANNLGKRYLTIKRTGKKGGQ